MSLQKNTTKTKTKIVFLHGLGQNASAWKPVIKNLSTTNTLSIDLFDYLSKEASMNIDSLNELVAKRLSHIKEPYILCGLSLGSIIALRQAIINDPLLKGIIISAGQFEAPNPLLLSFQNIMFHFLPNKTVAKLGLSKKQMIELTNSLKTLNLRPQLKKINIPVLLICGLDDKPNLGASKELVHLLSRASLKLVQGKHELNKEQPEIFAKLVTNFLGEVENMK